MLVLLQGTWHGVAADCGLREGYFDGTDAADIEGPRDLQNILFNGRLVPREEYNPWAHADSMCVWAPKWG